MPADGSLPGALAAASRPPAAGDDLPRSTLMRIKSERALKSCMDSCAGRADFYPESYVPVNPEDLEYLLKLDWVQDMVRQPGCVPAAAAMSEPGMINGIDPDHLFLSMLRQGLVRDIMFLYNTQQESFHCLIATTSEVSGHSGIVHGGFTSAVLDETTGGLVYELKKRGKLGPGPAFTARLEVDYKRPLPAGTSICCSAMVERVEGRKIFTVAELRDSPGGELFAVGKALYVTVRQPQQQQEAAKAIAAA